MAKVIKDPEGHKQAKCKDCLATIEYAPIEVKSHTYWTSGDQEVDYFVVCPNCEGKIEVKGKYL